jgi:hypothetical protein
MHGVAVESCAVDELASDCWKVFGISEEEFGTKLEFDSWLVTSPPWTIWFQFKATDSCLIGSVEVGGAEVGLGDKCAAAWVLVKLLPIWVKGITLWQLFSAAAANAAFCATAIAASCGLVSRFGCYISVFMFSYMVKIKGTPNEEENRDRNQQPFLTVFFLYTRSRRQMAEVLMKIQQNHQPINRWTANWCSKTWEEAW